MPFDQEGHTRGVVSSELGMYLFKAGHAIFNVSFMVLSSSSSAFFSDNVQLELD